MPWIRLLFTLALTSFIAGCGGGDDDDAAETRQNLLQALQAEARFSTLVEAFNAAGATLPLTQSGQTTVFAPTNEAFDALLAELGLSKAQMLADTGLLNRLLAYHMLRRKLASADVEPGHDATEDSIVDQLEGIFRIDRVGGALVVTDGKRRTANIVQADLPAANGVIHVLDRVLLPADQTITQTLVARPEFSTLLAAAQSVGFNLDRINLTLMAPTDGAFNALFAELGISREQFLNDSTLVLQVLNYHKPRTEGVDIALRAELLGQTFPTYQPDFFEVSAEGVVRDRHGRTVPIAEADVMASNGVIHVLAANVLLPDTE